MTIRLPDELARRLDHLVKETEQPRSHIIQKALESYLQDHDNLQAALERRNDTSDPIVSGKEMRESLGL
jgi:RHH-type rel operon transcriptional repressor/antitoxin RelB